MQNLSVKLHELFNGLTRFRYPFENQLDSIPNNGVYIKFEKGERLNEFDRIVRVGTDTGQDNLRNRLIEHFITENKNRSIFRKNIGRAFLNREQNPYLAFWELDTTSRIEKEKHLKFIDKEFEQLLERQISGYIRNSFSFCVFRVDTKAERLYWESKIISTLAQSRLTPSTDWLGNFSPKKQIKQSGLWQVQGLKKSPLTDLEFQQLDELIRKHS